MIQNVLPMLPLWVAGLLLFLLCILVFEGGGYIRVKANRRRDGDPEPVKAESEGHIVSAIFGLFAFIIGLTFSIALDRFDTRRGWVAEEATAITTMFFRSELLDEPDRTQLRNALRAYARTRVAPNGLVDGETSPLLARSHQARQKLWMEARNAAYPHRNTDLGGNIVEGVNQMLTAGTRRELAGTTHIPNRILNALVVYLLAASAVLGYLAGDHPGRSRVASFLLFALMSMAIVLILDLDRPRSGSIQVSQEALERVVAAMDVARTEQHAAPISAAR